MSKEWPFSFTEHDYEQMYEVRSAHAPWIIECKLWHLLGCRRIRASWWEGLLTLRMTWICLACICWRHSQSCSRRSISSAFPSSIVDIRTTSSLGKTKFKDRVLLLNKFTSADLKHRSEWFQKFRDPWERWVKFILNYVDYMNEVRIKLIVYASKTIHGLPY